MNKELKYPDKAKECSICEGSGVMTHSNGPDDYDKEECVCQSGHEADNPLCLCDKCNPDGGDGIND